MISVMSSRQSRFGTSSIIPVGAPLNEGAVGKGHAVPELLPVVGDRALDRVLGEDRAVDLHRGQVELVDDVDVLDRLGLLDGLALEPLGRERRKLARLRLRR